MAKISIITRAFNRLEYTVMCIRETYILAKNADYEHIIIEQSSSDGTKEWLKSLEIEGYYKIKVKYNEVNTGDGGGMKDGFDMISEDCKYILQLDNDLIPLTDNFLQKLSDIMDNDDNIGSIMLKREGVGHHLEMTELYKNYNGIELFHMKKMHGMFFRRDLLEKINYWTNKDTMGWVKHIPNVLHSWGYAIVKSPDIKILHIDTTGGQSKKFPKFFSSRIQGTNYKIFNYNNMKFNSEEYWENRYKSKSNSGSGSYGVLAEYKSDIINNFIKENNINDVVEFGCGDGNQLSKFVCNNYTGYDVSKTIINVCKEKFKNDINKKFYLYNEYKNEKYELSISLDVIFLLIENDVFEKYMTNLFNSSNKYIIIYSSNGDVSISSQSIHFQDRNFTNWVNENRKDFILVKKINNPHKFDEKINDGINTSVSNFYIFKKINNIKNFLIKHDNIKFEILCEDSFMCNYYSKNGLFYENKMLDYIKNNQICGLYIDVGAFIGNHSVFFSKMCDKCTGVMSYEPIIDSFKIFEENTKNINNVKGKNVAVGEKSGKCEMKIVIENTGMSYVSKINSGNIEMVTIDDEFKETKENIGLIKIDVEGYEYDVLKGSIDTINKFKPHLFIEIIGDISEIKLFLKQFGYENIQQFNNTPTYHFKPI